MHHASHAKILLNRHNLFPIFLFLKPKYTYFSSRSRSRRAGYQSASTLSDFFIRVLIKHDVIKKKFRGAPASLYPTLRFESIPVQGELSPAFEADFYSKNIPKRIDPTTGSVLITVGFIFGEAILFIGLFVVPNHNVSYALQFNTSDYLVGLFVQIRNKFFAVGVADGRVQNNPKGHVAFAVGWQVHFENNFRDFVTVDYGSVVTAHVWIKIILVFFIVDPAVAERRA